MTGTGFKRPEGPLERRAESADAERLRSLLLDERSARTEPSLRRRVASAGADAPTPVEPHSIRHRQRARRRSLWLALLGLAGIGALVVGVSARSSGSVETEMPVASSPAPLDASSPAIDAARTAELARSAGEHAEPAAVAEDVPDDMEAESELVTEVIDVRSSVPRRLPASLPGAGAQSSARGRSAGPPPVRSGLSEPSAVPSSRAAASAGRSPSVPPAWFPPE